MASQHDVMVIEHYHQDRAAKFSLYAVGGCCICDKLRRGQTWEPHLYDVFDKYVTKESVVIDAGAHIGTHSVKLAWLCKQIFCFEPLQRSYMLLRANLIDNGCGNAVAIESGLSDMCGVASIAWSARGNPGGTGLDKNPMGRPSWLPPLVNPQTVPVTTVDALGLGALHFMKLDVEGYESRVIAGAMETIARCWPTIVLECWTKHGDSSIATEDVYQRFDPLVRLGYRPQHIKGPDWLLLPKGVLDTHESGSCASSGTDQ